MGKGEVAGDLPMDGGGTAPSNAPSMLRTEVREVRAVQVVFAEPLDDDELYYARVRDGYDGNYHVQTSICRGFVCGTRIDSIAARNWKSCCV